MERNKFSCLEKCKKLAFSNAVDWRKGLTSGFTCLLFRIQFNLYNKDSKQCVTCLTKQCFVKRKRCGICSSTTHIFQETKFGKMDQNVCVLLFPFIRPVEDHPSEHTLSGTEQSGKTVNFVKSAFYFGRMFLLICFFFKN